LRVFPDSIAAILGILFVVAPGLVFEVVRERRRPTVERSTFREASWVALASLAFDVAALLVLAGIHAFWAQPFPDMSAWASEGLSYVIEQPWRVAAFLGAWAVLAVGGAIGAALVLFRRSTARIDPNTTAWYELFRKRVPRDSYPMASVLLDDGSSYAGEVVYYDANILPAERELILGPPLWYRTSDESELAPLPREHHWQRAVIAAPRIRAMWVRYPKRAEGSSGREAEQGQEEVTIAVEPPDEDPGRAGRQLKPPH
jgi:hypothetical protein